MTPLNGNRREAFGALEIAFLGRGQERMQHLDRRLEHLHEFEQALVGEAQAAGVAVGVRIVLRQVLQLANVDLADERRDVLVVVVARLGLGDRHLAQHRRLDAHDAEARQIAAELLEALDGPRRHDAVEIAAGYSVIRLQHRAEALRREKAERRLVDGRALDRIDGVFLHHGLEPLGDRRFAAADRAQQIENLLALLEPLRRMLEERDDLLDRLFHAEELAEGRVAPDDAVAEDPGETRVVAGVDLLRFADARQHPFRGARVGSRFPLAQREVVLEPHFLVLRGRIIRPEVVEQRRHRRSPIRPVTKMPDSRAVPSRSRHTERQTFLVFSPNAPANVLLPPAA